MGIRLALVLGDAHYGIGGKEGKTGATTKFTTATLLPTSPRAAESVKFHMRRFAIVLI